MAKRNLVSTICIIHFGVLCFCVVFLLSASAMSDVLKKPGDFYIGVLIPVHGSSSDGKCDEPDLKGILTVEAILYAIDQINSDRYLDLEATIGYEIRDTCFGAETAAYELIDPRTPNDQKNTSLAAVLGNLPQDKRDNVKSLRLLFSSLLPFISCDSSTYIPGEYSLHAKTLSAFVFHAVPSDSTNLQVIVDVMVHFHWSYAAIVYIDHAPGKHIRDLLVEKATSKNICIGKKYTLPQESTEEQIRLFIKTLKNGKNVSVIILLTPQDVSSRVIAEASRQGVSELIWLAGEGSWKTKKFVPSNNTAAKGLLKAGTYARVTDFRTHLKTLPQSPLRNKWLLEMVSKKESPSRPTPTASAPITSAQTNSPGLLDFTSFTMVTTAPVTSTQPADQCTDPVDPECNINTNLLREVEQKLTSMAEEAACTLDAVFAVAHALAAKENCSSKGYPWKFHECFKDLNFKSPTGHQVSFTSDGYPKEVEYQIYAYQKGSVPVSHAERTNLQRKQVGTWKLSANGEVMLKILEEKIQWNTDSDSAPEARCLKPCQPGEYKARKTRSDAKCCWHCLPCAEGSMSSEQDSESCTACPVTYRPNKAHDGCVKYFEEYAYWGDAGSLVMIFFMVTGICFSVYVSVVLFQNRDSPVMRRAKNASLWLLPFLVINFLIPIPLISKPSDSSCEGYRAFFILALGIPLAALLSKSHVVNRCFYGADGEIKGERLACVTRVVVVLIVVLLHVTVIVLLRVYLPSSVLRFPTDDPFTEYIECSLHSDFGFLTALLYLMAVATLVSLMSLGELISPRNDLEVKWISLCMFNWYALGFFYLTMAMGIQGKGKIFGMAFVVILYAVNLLVCIYLPKWYIIVFQPERNLLDVSPWTMYMKTQNKVSERLSAKEESPVLPHRGVASTAKPAGHWVRDNMESQELIHDTDV